MPGDCIGEKHIFKLGSSPDIMDDEGAEAIGGAFVRYDADMGQGADHLQVPGHEVAGFVIVRVLCDGEGLAVAGEEGLEVRDAAVVDVRIRPFQAPEFGVEAEMGLHVLVDLLLQVDAEGSVGADDDIGADAQFNGNVSTRIADLHIGRVIADRAPDLGLGSGHQFLLPALRADGRCGEAGGGEDEHAAREHGDNPPCQCGNIALRGLGFDLQAPDAKYPPIPNSEAYPDGQAAHTL